MGRELQQHIWAACSFKLTKMFNHSDLLTERGCRLTVIWIIHKIKRYLRFVKSKVNRHMFMWNVCEIYWPAKLVSGEKGKVHLLLAKNGLGAAHPSVAYRTNLYIIKTTRTETRSSPQRKAVLRWNTPTAASTELNLRPSDQQEVGVPAALSKLISN